MKLEDIDLDCLDDASMLLASELLTLQSVLKQPLNPTNRERIKRQIHLKETLLKFVDYNRKDLKV